MTKKIKSMVEEAVDQFLEGPPTADGTSLSASVPHALKVTLKKVAAQLGKKAPEREYTALQIASIVARVYSRGGTTPDCPVILKNMRAFGRFLQKHGGPNIGFVASGSVGNRRTYKPLSSKRPPLDS